MAHINEMNLATEKVIKLVNAFLSEEDTKAYGLVDISQIWVRWEKVGRLKNQGLDFAAADPNGTAGVKKLLKSNGNNISNHYTYDMSYAHHFETAEVDLGEFVDAYGADPGDNS